ncbi:MAG: serine/threonine protein phosphatase [Methanocalculaceae archaeon]|jgi:RIO kinase 2|nr:serine/threonine protein phosphatase [Methanocalculaceae archaeon]
MPLSADDIKNLHPYEIRILHALERMMRRHSWVPEDDLKMAVHLSAVETNYRVGSLIQRGMVRSDSVPYKGYALVFKGYDALALFSLAQQKSISALGFMIGVGKESEIYEARGCGIVVLKLHKVGQRSFQTVRINREYMPEHGHCPWIFASAKSAKREYEALKALNGKLNVPVPINQNRHVIVMSLIPGVSLHRSRLEDPGAVWQDILAQVKVAYDAGYIHGDLSEYNIMHDGAVLWIIDWPQWTTPEHPNATAALRHDLETVSAFFAKKYQRIYDVDEAIRFVTSGKVD